MTRALLVAMLAASCGDRCELPERTRYTCKPLPAGSAGCVGGPVWIERDGDEKHHDDPDKTFPNGCRAEVPECSGFYEGGRRFECTSGQWIEPI